MKNTLTYPSYSGWITARTDDIQLTTDNMLLILPKPIVQLQQMLLNLESAQEITVDITYIGSAGSTSATNVKLTEFSTTQSDSGLLKVLDVTSYIIEYDKYRTLDAPSYTQGKRIDKSNTAYYERYGEQIKFVTTKQSWWVLNPLTGLIRNAFDDVYQNGLYYKHVLLGVTNYYPVTSISFGTDANWKFLQWQWRIVYEPLGENTKLTVPKTNAEEIPFAIPYNQQQQIASSVGLGRNMQSVANRTGTEQKQVVRYITKLSQMRRVGAVATLNGEIWRLTEVAGTFTPIRARITETWTKGWSMRSEYVGINREFRSWNIPSEITERNLLYQDYCLITRKANLNLGGAKIGTNAHNLLMYFIDQSKSWSGVTEQSAMWLMRDQTNGAILSSSAFGFGNSLVFSARTKDNLSAGIQRVKLNDTDSNYQQNVDVYYCNGDGTLEKFNVQFGADISNLDSMAYPESKIGTTNTLDTTAPYLFNTWTEFAVDKDPAEQLNFTYQLHMLTDDPNLIIGSMWAGRNPLVHQYNSTPTRKYWSITKRLPQGAQVMTSIYGTSGISATACKVNVSTSGSRAYENIVFTVPSGSLGVCVTDENNNILVAWQGGASATFTTYYTHDYGAIKKAVKS